MEHLKLLVTLRSPGLPSVLLYLVILWVMYVTRMQLLNDRGAIFIRDLCYFYPVLGGGGGLDYYLLGDRWKRKMCYYSLLAFFYYYFQCCRHIAGCLGENRSGDLWFMMVNVQSTAAAAFPQAPAT